MGKFVFFNPNPDGKRVGDCAVRAISKALNQDWEATFIALSLQGLLMCDLPNANAVWGAYLRGKGFRRSMLPEDCPDCYTVAEFAEEHRDGTYILALSNHVVCVQDGNWFDVWDSGGEIPIYYWLKEEK